jgi:Co/Zn/Cd efflux system component
MMNDVTHEMPREVQDHVRSVSVQMARLIFSAAALSILPALLLAICWAFSVALLQQSFSILPNDTISLALAAFATGCARACLHDTMPEIAIVDIPGKP